MSLHDAVSRWSICCGINSSNEYPPEVCTLVRRTRDPGAACSCVGLIVGVRRRLASAFPLVSLQLGFQYCPQERLTRRLGGVPLCRIGRDGARRRVLSRPGRSGTLRYSHRCISLRTGGSEDETIGRCEDVVDGAVRTRAGQGLGGVGASDVARLLAGRPDPGGTDESGGRAGSVPGGCAATVRGPAVRPQQLRCGGRVGVVCAGEPGDAGRGPPSIAEVEAFCADTGYPQTRFDAAAPG